MAVRAALLASLFMSLVVGSAFGADPILFSQLKKTLDVKATPSKEGEVLEAGKDKVTITWSLNSSVASGADSTYKTVSIKLCYAPISQVDRPWRHTKEELDKDKTCTHKIASKPYNKKGETFEWTVAQDIPSASYFVRAYALNSQKHEVAYGQSTDKQITTNIFQVNAISGRSTPLDIASICFSVFSVVSLFGFFFNEKRKARKMQGK